MRIDLNQDVHTSNNKKALELHHFFAKQGITVINLVGSPGSGKTSLLEALLPYFKAEEVGVIEGDLFTDLDHQRIVKLNVQSYQLNTNGACHLEAAFLNEALPHLNFEKMKYLFIDNIGNLVCTASYYLGEDIRITVTSTTEGNDKPYKYPKMFHTSDIVVVNKMDLAPYTNFSIDDFKQAIKNINPEIIMIPISCTAKEKIESIKEAIINYA